MGMRELIMKFVEKNSLTNSIIRSSVILRLLLFWVPLFLYHWNPKVINVSLVCVVAIGYRSMADALVSNQVISHRFQLRRTRNVVGLYMYVRS